MYAVIRTGGKQYKVKAGDVLRVEKLEKNLGEEFDVQDILYVSGQTGATALKNAAVTVVVTRQFKGPKIIVFKRRRRQGYRRFNGHRQPYTELFIKAITAPNGEKVVTDVKAPIQDPAKKAQRKADAAAKAASEAGTTGTRKTAKAKKVVKKAAAPKAKKVTKKTSKVAKKKTATKKK